MDALPDMPTATLVPPRDNIPAERLSHSPVSAKQIKRWTDRDPVLSQVRRFLMQGWPPVVGEGELTPYAKRKN